jgi:hypothetical protein
VEIRSQFRLVESLKEAHQTPSALIRSRPVNGASRFGGATNFPVWCQCPVSPASFAACAVCFSLRAMFRVCHDLPSVLGFGCNFLRDSRAFGAVVVAMFFSFSSRCQTRAGPVSHLQRL